MRKENDGECVRMWGKEQTSGKRRQTKSETEEDEGREVQFILTSWPRQLTTYIESELQGTVVLKFSPLKYQLDN